MKALISLLETVEIQTKEKWMTDADILSLRLAPDMLPFVKQIQIVSDNAKWMASRLAGKISLNMKIQNQLLQNSVWDLKLQFPILILLWQQILFMLLRQKQGFRIFLECIWLELIMWLDMGFRIFLPCGYCIWYSSSIRVWYRQSRLYGERSSTHSWCQIIDIYFFIGNIYPFLL